MSHFSLIVRTHAHTNTDTHNTHTHTHTHTHTYNSAHTKCVHYRPARCELHTHTKRHVHTRTHTTLQTQLFLQCAQCVCVCECVCAELPVHFPPPTPWTALQSQRARPKQPAPVSTIRDHRSLTACVYNICPPPQKKKSHTSIFKFPV